MRVRGLNKTKRHLLKRIEEPMTQFESNQNVLAGKDAKRIIKVGHISGLLTYISQTTILYHFFCCLLLVHCCPKHSSRCRFCHSTLCSSLSSLFVACPWCQHFFADYHITTYCCVDVEPCCGRAGCVFGPIVTDCRGLLINHCTEELSNSILTLNNPIFVTVFYYFVRGMLIKWLTAHC